MTGEIMKFCVGRQTDGEYVYILFEPLEKSKDVEGRNMIIPVPGSVVRMEVKNSYVVKSTVVDLDIISAYATYTLKEDSIIDGILLRAYGNMKTV